MGIYVVNFIFDALVAVIGFQMLMVWYPSGTEGLQRITIVTMMDNRWFLMFCASFILRRFMRCIVRREVVD